MLYRLMEEGDRPAALALWREVFGDGPGFVNACLDGFAGPGNVFVAQENGEAGAVLLAAPCTAAGQSGAYFYALATRPTLRGRGVMSGLMLFAEKALRARGAAFAALIPASAPLFGFYRQRGYVAEIALRRLCVEIDATVPADGVCFGPPCAETLSMLRAKWLRLPCVAFEGAPAALIAQDLADAGAVMAQSDAGYAVFGPGKTGPLVAELAARDEAAAKALLGAVAHKTGWGKAELTLPEKSALFAGAGETVPAALAKPFEGAQPLPAGLYLRFALDEVWAAGG